MELGWASITANNDSKVCAMNKNTRINLKSAIMTVESEMQVCKMRINSRMELGCAIMTVERKICRMHKSRRTQGRNDC